MRKFVTAIIIALSSASFLNAANNNVTLSAAVPVYVERFDWSLGQGGNDNIWTNKNAKSINGYKESTYYSYCAEANMCIRVGTTSLGEVSVSEIPNTKGFLTVRAGAYLDKEENSCKIHFETSSGTDLAAYPKKFSCMRRSFTGTNKFGNITIEGTDNYNFKFFLDDFFIYSETSDISKLKSASRIILSIGTYSKEQISLLQEIVSENKNLTSIDLWSAKSDIRFELNPANPNCIIFDPNNLVTNDINIAHCVNNVKDVNQYVCNNLVIKDNFPFDPIYDFTAKNVSYDREFQNIGKEYYSTICIPFAIEKDASKIHKILNFVKFDASNEQLVFEEVSAIQANTPYVISVANKQPFLNLTNANVKIQATSPRFIWESPSLNASDIQKEQNKRCKLCGTYTQRTDLVSNLKQAVYGFSKGKFVKVEEGCTFNPFRSYITIEKGNDMLAKELKLTTFEEIVGIPATSTEKEEDVSVYDTNGIFVTKASNYKKAIENLNKGIYIINGEKTLIK